LPPELFASSSPMVDFMANARRLWRGRRFVIAVTFASALISIGWSLLQHNEFTAILTALPPGKSSTSGKIGQLSDVSALAGVRLPNMGDGSVDEITAILDSRTLQERLIEEFSLREYYLTSTTDDTLSALRRSFSPQHDKKTNRITISFTHRDPKIASALANRAGTILQESFNAIQRSSSKRERVFLESRIVVAERDWTEALSRLAEFQRQHHAYQLEAQSKATVELVGTLEGQLIAQQIELRALLTSQASQDNPQIVLLQKRVEELSRALGRLIGGLDGETSTGGVLIGLSALPEIGIQYASVVREAKKHEALVATLTAQAEYARIAEVRDSDVVTIVDVARIPERKSGPKRSVLCIVGTLFGCFVGMAVVLLRESMAAWRRALNEEEDAP